MLKLTLANGAVVEIDDGDNGITNRDELSSVFDSTAYLDYNDGDANVNNILFDVADDEDMDDYGMHGDYIRVVSAEWCFAESGYVGCDTFKQFVQAEMNRYCEDGADWCYDVIMHGCAGGTVSSLIYTSDIIKVLSEHARDIQFKVQEIADNIGGMDDFMTDFTFDRLVWMCFEETVRDVLLKLELDDV